MGFMREGSDEERRAAFIESLTNNALNQSNSAALDVYQRYLGLRPAKNNRLNIIELVKSGLPLSAGKTLAGHMGVEIKTFFTAYVGMSDSTMRRRLKDQTAFSVDESDRVVRYAHLLGLATQLMEGSEEDAREWLAASSPALGGATPLQTATTEAGARRVEDLIVSLEYGMFS
jgi:putative toxin-antitoxin system antitoxin component (TIGR02293 family)